MQSEEFSKKKIMKKIKICLFLRGIFLYSDLLNNITNGGNCYGRNH